MTAPVFVDTNVLVYSRDARDAVKNQRAREWVEFLWDTKRGRVSRQVLLSEDLPAGQNLEGIRVVSPFVTRPSGLGDLAL